MSVKLEYGRCVFGVQNYDFTDPAPFTIGSGYSVDSVKLGVNFHL